MLCLSLLPGEYLTIGGDVVVQVDRMAGNRCGLKIDAPREVPILRGEVWERGGGKRPDCVFTTPRWYKAEIPWDRSKEQALAAMRRQLAQMGGRDSGVQALRRQLDHLFPPERDPNEISNG